MRFLIADDVTYARGAVEKLLKMWNQDAQIVASCENGAQVLKALEKEDIDVMVLDIQMPGVNGLEISDLVHRHYPHIKILLVTGHAEFEYARQAVKSGVFRYLLKPLRKEELFFALDELKETLDKAKGTLAQQQNIYRVVNSYRMMNYLSGGDHIEPHYPLPAETLQKGFMVGALLCRNITYDQLKKAMETCLEEECFFYEDILQKGCWMILLCNFEHLPLGLFQKKSAAQLEALTQWIPAQYGLVALCALVPPCPKTDLMPRQYLLSKKGLAMRLFRPKERIFIYKDEPEEAKKMLTGEEKRMIITWLKGKKIEEVQSFIRRKLEGRPLLELWQAEQLYDDFSSMALLVRAEQGLALQDQPQVRQLWSFDHPSQVEAYLYEVMYGKGGLVQEEEGGIIKEIKAFLQENYYCEISLNDLAANKYFMNPNYLSRLFKAEEGIGFSRYLLNLRMEKAKEMLARGDMNINEVAMMVGYTSTSYFIANFKKHYGETPGAFLGEEK